MKPENLKFLSKFAWVCLPVFLWLAWQASLSPIQYTFRGWEAIIAGPHWRSGFFPAQDFKMNEVGDLGAYTVNAVPHEVLWQTDTDGYRNSPETCTQPETVILGDSMAMGASLSQADTVSEQLAKRLKQCVRSFAGGKLNRQIERVFQKELHPKWVILILAERNTHVVQELEKVSVGKSFDLQTGVQRPLAVMLTRLRNPAYWSYRAGHGVWAALKRSFTSSDEASEIYAPRKILPAPPEAELLYYGHISNADDSDADLLKLKNDLDQFAVLLRKQGARLVVSFVPNKESIYQDAISSLSLKLKTNLQSEQFVYLDAITAFRAHYEKDHERLHQSDDTHWNARGVALFTELLEPVLKPR